MNGLSPERDDEFPGEELTPDLDDALREASSFDADVLALVADVRRIHLDGEAPAGGQW